MCTKTSFKKRSLKPENVELKSLRSFGQNPTRDKQ